MPKLPFDIPPSLSSYVEQFDEQPEKVTQKLKSHLKKRGLDSVGHFLLAWFYHLRGMREKAINHAMKAKTFAPGSPLMEHLHYFLVHPQSFEAWLPGGLQRRHPNKKHRLDQPSPALDLDELIAKLSAIESKRIKPPENLDAVSDADLSEPASEVENIASETLAKIYEQQGKTKKAVSTYKRLKEIYPDKSDYFQEQIVRLSGKTTG